MIPISVSHIPYVIANEVILASQKDDLNLLQKFFNSGFEKQESGDHEGAIEDYSKALEIDPKYVLVWWGRGLSKNQLGDYQGAIDDYSKALEIDPKYVWAWSSRGGSKAQIGDHEGAINDYSKALEIDPQYLLAWSSRGYSKNQLEDYEGAIDDYSKALEIDPQYLLAWWGLGTSKYQLEDYEGAINDYSKVLEIDPKNVLVWERRGKSKEQLEDYEGAINDYSQALDIDPQYVFAWSNRGYSKYQLEDYEGAIDDYSKALDIDPDYVFAWFSRGNSKGQLGDYEGAIEDYSKALEIEPQYVFAWSGRGSSKSSLGDHEGAINDYSKALEIDPDYVYAWSGRGSSKSSLGDHEGAINDYSKALEIDPDYVYAWSGRGSSKSSLGDHEGAINDYSKALEIDPDYVYAWLRRGDNKRVLDDKEGALSDYEQVINLGGSREEILVAIESSISLYLERSEFTKIPNLVSKAKTLLKYNKAEKGIANARFNYLEALYYSSSGDNTKVIQLLEENQAIFSALNLIEEDPSELLSRNLLIVTYMQQDQYKKAKSLIQRGTSEGELYSSFIALQEGDLKKAERILKRLNNVYKQKSINNKADPTILSTLGLAYWWQGENKKAQPYIEEGLELYKEYYGENNPILIQPLLNIAMVHFKNEEYEEADDYLRKSLRLQFKEIQEKAFYLPISKRQDFVKRLGISYAAIFSASDIHPIGKDLAFFARINRHGLLEEIEREQSKLSSLKGSQRKLLGKIKAITNTISSNQIKDQMLINKLISEKESLEIELYRTINKRQSRIVEVSDIANVLSKDSVLIEFQKYRPFKFDQPRDALEVKNWGKPLYQALILKPNGEIHSINLGFAKSIDIKIQEALQASEEIQVNAQALWAEVGDLVIEPLANVIGNIETLFISPDGELNRIPFAALSSSKNNKLLGEEVNLRLLTTGRELLDLQEEYNLTNQTSLVVANPSFNLISDLSNDEISDETILASQKRSGDLGSSTWDSLPGTVQEGQSIAQLTNGRLLMKSQATVLAVQESYSPKILHIASHSYFLMNDKNKDENITSMFIGQTSSNQFSVNENSLLRSGIVLAGANQPDLNPQDDGYLTALEVTKLDWQGTELAVISGCESGQGDIQSGEGVYGLKRAIAVAGARSSLLSLWEVDDRATASFMTSFYQKLKDGEGRADALANTQKEFRNHSIPGYRHPYVWAAFQLSGDWRPILW
ncbi:CHAT domain-containing protein [Prochlorococcus marinus]|uniref:CHAT domain-containing protein n=1 Tax=Prochlorococcus marinus TaxID=1219 RepID=UPI0022B50220|nr:CHAT domain-containing protein [Prochlorococcus marinus]